MAALRGSDSGPTRASRSSATSCPTWHPRGFMWIKSLGHNRRPLPFVAHAECSERGRVPYTCTRPPCAKQGDVSRRLGAEWGAWYTGRGPCRTPARGDRWRLMGLPLRPYRPGHGRPIEGVVAPPAHASAPQQLLVVKHRPPKQPIEPQKSSAKLSCEHSTGLPGFFFMVANKSQRLLGSFCSFLEAS